MAIHSILIAALAMLAQAGAAPAPAQTAPAAQPGDPVLEAQVLEIINRIRANPAAYAGALRQYRSHFEDNVVLLPGSDVGLRTREGVAAVDEAIAFLSKQKPMPAFLGTQELVDSARELVAHQSLSGGTDHAAADGADAKARITRHKGSGFMAEALSYGGKDAAGVVRQLIIDDGVPTRPHRQILFDKKYFRAGVACGGHPVARTMCAIDFSTFVGLVQDPKKVRNPPIEVDIH